MGVGADFLPRVLAAAGRPLDLAEYRNGILLGPNNRNNNNNNNNNNRRPLRIGIDVSAWIYRAGFAYGDRLMADDRPLTAYGRASLRREQQQQQQERGSVRDRNGNTRDRDSQQQQQQQQQHKQLQEQTLRDYCEACANYVIRRLKILKEESNADLLVVFDGRTPPIKTATVAKRRRDRCGYQEIRDDVDRRVRANRRAGPGKHVPRIVRCLLDKLRMHANAQTNAQTNAQHGVLASWMVAPYEADSQLAYLSKLSYIDLVVAEDTDLVAHGCRAVLYRCLEPTTSKGDGSGNGSGNDNRDNDHNNNNAAGRSVDIARGQLLEFHDLGRIRSVVGEGRSSSNSNNTNGAPQLDLTDFTPVMMAVLFVLLGCDYNGYQKLKGIGIATGCKIDEYQRSFVEALVMYRHPGNCLRVPAPVPFGAGEVSTSEEENNGDDDDENEQEQEPLLHNLRSRSRSHLRRQAGDAELVDGCREYTELLSDHNRMVRVVGELPPTRKECIDIAEGVSHDRNKDRTIAAAAGEHDDIEDDVDIGDDMHIDDDEASKNLLASTTPEASNNNNNSSSSSQPMTPQSQSQTPQSQIRFQTQQSQSPSWQFATPSNTTKPVLSPSLFQTP
eukprot:jgi/Psemu1/291707/fgenesh1_pg.783_\